MKALSKVLLSSYFIAQSVAATPIFYTDEAAFNADSAALTFLMEDFTSSTAGALAFDTTYNFNGFSASASQNTTGSNNTGFEIFPVGHTGSQHAPFTTSQYLGWAEDTPNKNGSGGYGATVTLNFATQLNALAFNFLDSDRTDEYHLSIDGVDIMSAFPSFGSSYDSAGFFGVLDISGISSVIFSADSTSPGGYVEEFGIDNVRTSQITSVPEPSTLAIFGLGILGLAFRRVSK